MTAIDFILTGGTLDSAPQGNNLTTGSEPSTSVKEAIAQICGARDLSFKIHSPFTKNSEDLTLADVDRLCSMVNGLVTTGATRIVIIHGTDSLHFSGYALWLNTLRNPSTARIAITGAFVPLSGPDSEAFKNMEASVDWTDQNTASHSAPNSNIAVCWGDYQDDAGNNIVSGQANAAMLRPLDRFSTSLSQIRPPQLATALEQTPPLGQNLIDALNTDTNSTSKGPVPFTNPNRVHLTTAYVGMNSVTLDAIATGADVVVIDGYHSGTAPSLSGSDIGLTETIQASSDTLFVIAGAPEKGTLYQSLKRLEDAGAVIARGIAGYQAYLIACAAISANLEKNTLRQLFT